MTVSFDALPADAWGAIAACIAQPWPVEAARHDLRWYAARHGLTGAPLPSLRELAARWGLRGPRGQAWTKDRVGRLIEGGSWLDVTRPWAWEGVGENEGAATDDPAQNRRDETATRQQRDSNATAAHDSTPETDARRDSNATATRQQRDSRARSGTPNTLHPGGARARARGPDSTPPPAAPPPPLPRQPPAPLSPPANGHAVDLRPPPAASTAPGASRGPSPSPSPPLRRPADMPDGPPPDDLAAYCGLSLRSVALALVDAGITDRAGLLALSADELRHTRGCAGARTASLLARIAAWGDALAPDPAPRARGSPGRRVITSAELDELDRWAQEPDPTPTPTP